MSQYTEHKTKVLDPVIIFRRLSLKLCSEFHTQLYIFLFSLNLYSIPYGVIGIFH
jgi:hypothetical protein